MAFLPFHLPIPVIETLGVVPTRVHSSATRVRTGRGGLATMEPLMERREDDIASCSNLYSGCPGWHWVGARQVLV